MQIIAELITKKYTPGEANNAIASLSQGELDVLKQVRDTLGWPSIKSLAVKYYPAYPNRKWWLEASRRVNKWARKKNITYFLKCLQSIATEHLEAAFSGKGALNRLIHKVTNSSKTTINRLEGTAKGETFRGRLGPYQRVVLARMGGVTF